MSKTQNKGSVITLSNGEVLHSPLSHKNVINRIQDSSNPPFFYVGIKVFDITNYKRVEKKELDYYQLNSNHIVHIKPEK